MRAKFSLKLGRYLPIQKLWRWAKLFQELKPKIEKEGFLKSMADMVINMMPPRLSDKLRDVGGGGPRP